MAHVERNPHRLELRRCAISLCAMASLVALSTVRAEAGVAEDRAQRHRCLQLWMSAPRIDQGFEVPRIYEPVSEPGGIFGLLKNGVRWHPARSDVERLGVRIETTPTDFFEILPLTSMHAVKVTGGTVYSRIECERLDCLFKTAFVSSSRAALAADCGVPPVYLRIVGASDQGEAAARRAITFRWGENGTLPLAELETDN
jgi:hypothetical protein